MSIVYLVTNVINGKRYVGVTTKSISERFKAHVKTARKKKDRHHLFHAAILKHGRENFVVEILEEHETTRDACQREMHLINELGTLMPGGYNMTRGGEGPNGHVHNERTREKMSKSARSYWLNEENRLRRAQMRPRGEMHGRARLNERDVIDFIKLATKMASDGSLSQKNKVDFCKDVARKLGVKWTTVWAILDKQSWKHLVFDIPKLKRNRLTRDVVKEMRCVWDVDPKRGCQADHFLSEWSSKTGASAETIRKIVFRYTWQSVS